MLRGPVRDSGGVLTGSALVQCLVRLTDARAPEPRQVFAERLSHWLGWADAISLSSALSPVPAPAPAPGRPVAAEQDAARLRAALAKGHATAVQATKDDTAPLMTSAPDAASFLPFRRCCHERQQAMDLAVGPLRARLQAQLAGRSATMARLAAVDGVMAQVVGERERTLLAAVPVLLEKRFEQLRQAAAAATPADAAPVNNPLWLHTFRQDLLSVLHAELDLRFQPIEGLLAALRAAAPRSGTRPAASAPPSPVSPTSSR